MEVEVIVVGAGAAGLLAAIRAAEFGSRVLLLEKNRRAGTKILMSGGTRCNITHATDRQGIIEAFGEQGRFLHSALAALPPEALIELIEAEGVATKVEPGGKIFPVSDRALDVLRALTGRLERSGARIALGEPLQELTRCEAGGFRLTTPLRSLRCKCVIVTTGGKSYPGCGTTGDGYEWLSRLGHAIVPPRAALTPVTSDANWVHDLKGVTLPDVQVDVCESTNRSDGSKSNRLARRRGGFLFTHFGASGPVVMDVSRAITGYEQPRGLHLDCDFLPHLASDTFSKALRGELQEAGGKHALGIVSQWIPKRLAESIYERIGLSAARRAAEVSKADLHRIVAEIKHARIPVSGTRGFKKAEVTAGGVALTEIDSRTLQSRLVPGLFVAGELLDIDGPIGGYNFQAAFSTAWLAATHASKHVRELRGT